MASLHSLRQGLDSTRRRYEPLVRAALTPALVEQRREAEALGVTFDQLALVKAWHLQMLPSLGLLSDGLILDVGAHDGLWTDTVLQLAPTARIIAVEPQDGPRAELTRRFGDDPRVTIDGRALADSQGTREFHIMESTVNASLRPPREHMDALYGSGWAVQETTTIETTTVDALVGGRPVALLKIDVQGAENDVLAGATETLKHTTAVMLEVTYIHHYEGDATFATLQDTMVAAGFQLTGLSEPARSPQGALLCADACFVSADHLDRFFAQQG
jgi:FkbM family methyltransferase